MLHHKSILSYIRLRLLQATTILIAKPTLLHDSDAGLSLKVAKSGPKINASPQLFMRPVV